MDLLDLSDCFDITVVGLIIIKNKLKNVILSNSFKTIMYNRIDFINSEKIILRSKRNKKTLSTKNFCILTGRSKGVYSLFGLSRHKVRELQSIGILSGFQKTS